MKNCQYCHKTMEDELEICPLCNNQAPEIIPEKKHVPTFSLQELLLLLGAGTLLGVMHNYLMYGLARGISIPIFALLFLVTLYSIARILKIETNRNMFIVGLAIFVFSIFQSVRVGGMLTSYNTLAIYFTSLLLLTLLVKKRFEDITLPSYFFGFIKIIMGSFIGCGIWIKDFTSLGLRFQNTEKNIHILKGIFMAIPLVFIFTALFSSADLVFQNFLKNLFNFKTFDLIHISERLINIIFFCVVFVGVFTFISYAVRAFKKEEEKIWVIDDKKHIEINIMLSIISLLFLIFVIVQLGYLFGGEQMILSAGHTYAEYATRGFQELAIIALIVFVLFWKIDQYLYDHKKPSSSGTYKGLSSLIICLTLLILFSAFHRLWLYETTYGYTEVRFYGYVFIIVLGLSLLITLYKVLEFIKEGHFLISIISLYGTALIICNIISPESFITESNTVKTYRGSLRMDSSYIGGRSEDAIDKMITTYETLAPEKKKDMEKQFCTMLQRLKKEYSWQEWNYARYHAWGVLSEKEVDLKCSNENIPNSNALYIPNINNVYLHPENPQEIEAYTKKNGRNAVVLYYEGNVLYGKGLYPAAIEKYLEGIKINDNFERLHLNLGNAYDKLGRSQEALDSYNKGLSICQTWCEDLSFNIGKIYSHTGKYVKAIMYYDMAIQKNPSYKKAIEGRKYALYMLSKMSNPDTIGNVSSTGTMISTGTVLIEYPALLQTK